MALTRPKFSQFDTTITSISDPLTILNKSATIANIDVGFVINRNGGGVSNVALIWQESSNQFILAATSSNGDATANIVVTSYSNLRLGSVSAGNVTASGIVAHGLTNYVSHQYVLYGTSTNATEIELLIDGTTRMPVSLNTTISYEVNIASRRTDAANESAAWMIQGVADNFAGTVANVGNVYEVIIARDDVTWDVDARADNTNKTINIYATGAVGKTIRWVAVVKTIEVTQ